MVALEGIIFDFNGVIWWDSEIQERAWREFAGQVRGKPFSTEEMATHVHGRTNKHTLEYLTGCELSKAEIEKLTAGKESHYRSLCLAKGAEFRLSPGAEELLDFIVQRNIPHTIATASEINNLRFFIERLTLDRWFDVSKIVYDDGHRPGKPAPDIYLHAAEALNLPPAKCAVIEDATSGIQAAHAAGIGCIIALAQAAKREKMATLPGVAYVVENLSQVRKEDF